MERKLSALGEIKRLDTQYNSLRDQKVRPKKDFILNAINIIVQFLVEKKRILYGGTATRFSLIKYKDTIDRFDDAFDPTSTMDLDFLSPTPLQDAVEITKLLALNGYKPHIENALHDGTYKIKSDFHSSELVDASYLFKYFYDRLPFDVDPDTGLRYVTPNFQIINLYKMLIDPMRSWFKLEKQYLRITMLEHYYLYPQSVDYPKRFSNRTLAKTQPNPWIITENLLKNRTNILIVGEHAYNVFIEASELPDRDKRFIPILYPSVIVKDSNEKSFLDACDAYLTDYLAIKRREFYSFLEFFQRSYHYVDNNDHVVLEILVTNVCMPFEIFDGFTFGSFHVQLFTLYVKMWYAFFYNLDKDRSGYLELILNLQFAREHWLHTHNKIGIEEDAALMRELQGDCIGDDIPSQLELMFSNGKPRHVWRPGQSPPSQNIKYPNHSGKERIVVRLSN